MELWLDDVARQRNKKYGFNNTCQVIKAIDYPDYSLILLMTFRMSYFSPSGKARLKPEYRYDVRIQSHDHRNLDGSRFNFTSKSKAIKHFNKVKTELIKSDTAINQ